MNSITAKPSSNPYHKLFNFTPKTNPFHRAVSYISFSVFRKKNHHKRQRFCTPCSSKLTNSSTFNSFNNSSLPSNLLSFFTPVLQSVRNFTANYTRVSSHLQDPAVDKLACVQNNNGGIAMTFLSIKSTAKDKFSPFIATLAANPTFMSGLLAFLLAQLMKVMLNFCVEKKWDLKLLCSSGGMPSAHSALCTALSTSVALCHGVADALFPVCLGFSLVVMYDAIGVRRHAGMQAEVLNKIIEDLFQGHPISERKLKELLGHTPSQVIAGALLGIVVAFYCCQGCLVPI